MTESSRYIKELESLKSIGNYRQLHQENKGLYDLCSNDYLGLNHDEKLYARFMGEVFTPGLKFSSSSSRLLSIHSGLHLELEKTIAGLYKKETSLLFNSGYHANVGLLSALAGKKDLIVADKFVHASIIDGAKLSQADFIRYRHLDYGHLDNLLAKSRSKYEEVFIVSESIFSMDGDIANIQVLSNLKNKYNCRLYIDEAHGLGVRGKNGLGCVEEQGVVQEVDLIVGALGKAMASVGGFVVCNNTFRDYLVNHARSFIFSTCLPPVNIAWTKYIFESLHEMDDKRKKLSILSEQFSELIGTKPQSQIIPFIVGDNSAAIRYSDKLKTKGFNALPVRYPTVPKGTARLRFSLGAHMNLENLKPIKELIN